MLKKIALLAASLTAALVIAGGLALAGFGAPAAPGTAGDMQVVDQVLAPVDAGAPVDAVAPEPVVQVDTIYLAPQATPKEITVTTIKEAKATSHGDDGDHEGDHDGDHQGGDD